MHKGERQPSSCSRGAEHGTQTHDFFEGRVDTSLQELRPHYSSAIGTLNGSLHAHGTSRHGRRCISRSPRGDRTLKLKVHVLWYVRKLSVWTASFLHHKKGREKDALRGGGRSFVSPAAFPGVQLSDKQGSRNFAKPPPPPSPRSKGSSLSMGPKK